MIPRDFITEWRSIAPWVADHQVEQDLAISRALVDLFSMPAIGAGLAFRGGTALYKLHVRSPARYSEDIDLVQTEPGAAGALLDAIHAALDPWLGAPQWKQSQGRVTLNYRMASEDQPPRPLRLKVEINSREHFNVLGLVQRPFVVSSRWFTGSCSITTFELDELIGTKLRALFQRKKGRDLFDLGLVLAQRLVAPDRVVECFQRYMEAEGQKVTRAMFEQNLAEKQRDPTFGADLTPLLAAGHAFRFAEAMALVQQELVSRLPGSPWKGLGKRGP